MYQCFTEEMEIHFQKMSPSPHKLGQFNYITAPPAGQEDKAARHIYQYQPRSPEYDTFTTLMPKIFTYPRLKTGSNL